MALPFLAAAISTYHVFLVMFRGREITSHVRSTFNKRNQPSNRRPCSLTNGVPSSGPILLTATLGVPVGTSVLGIPIWQITVPPVVIVLHRDVVTGACLVLLLGYRITDGHGSGCSSTTFSGRTRVLEAPHPKLSHFKIPNRNDRVEADSHRPCAVCAFDARARLRFDEEKLG